MTRIGDIGTSRLLDWDVRASFYVSLALIKKCDRIKSAFLNQLIKSPGFQRQLYGRTLHVAFPKKINLGEIGKCTVKIPDVSEQQKIAAFLTAVDTKIEQLTRKEALLKQYKKGVMQKIFSQEIRFKADDGSEFPEWKRQKLGDFTTMFSGGTPTSTNKSYYEGTIPFIGSGDISSVSVSQRISEQALNSSSAKLVNTGDLLYALYGATSGEVAVSQISGAINQAVLCIRTSQDIAFLFFWLKYKKQQVVAKYLQGGQGNLSGKIVKDLDIELPAIEEQKKISASLASIADKINRITVQIDAMKTFKKGLLQQMFV